MTRLQKAQLRQSEIRSQIAAELDKEIETREDGLLERLTREAQSVEIEVRASLVVEQEHSIPDTVETPEGRELDELFRRSSVSAFVDETLTGAPLQGANVELRSALLGDNLFGYLPLDLLLEPDERFRGGEGGRFETRADAVTNVATAIQDNQNTIAARVFARSATAYLGAMMPSVPVGDVSYPRLTSGTTADIRSDGVELDGAAAALTTDTISPVRLTASYTFGVETLARIVGFEEALRQDLRSVMADKLDSLTINGQAAADSVSPVVAGVISSLADPTNPSDAAIWSDYVTAYDGAVDGRYAITDQEVRLLVNPQTWRHCMGLQIATSGDLVRDMMPRDRFVASANMPTVPSSGDNANIATALRYASGASAMARGMIVPVWRGIQLIVDPYTKAKSGQRIITAVQMIGFSMSDAAAYGRLEFKLA